MDLKKTGALIAAIRKELGLTQEQLGEKLYVTGKAVSKWERGVSAPGIDLLEPLARVLGITVTELLAGERVEQEALPAKSEEIIIETVRQEHLNRKRFLFICAAILLLFAGYVLAENWSALGERGNPLPYLAKVPVILTQGYVELDKDEYGGVPLMTFRGARKRAFAYIEKRWEVEYVEQLGRGFRFVGEDCSVTALRDGYLGLFTVWGVYAYPES